MTKQLKKEKSSQLFVSYNVELSFTSWKRRFKSDQIKLLIAVALNEWTSTYQNSLRLNGYLITNQSLYLVLKMEKDEDRKQSAFLFNVLREKFNHQELHAFLDQDLVQKNNEPALLASLYLAFFYHLVFEKIAHYHHHILTMEDIKENETGNLKMFYQRPFKKHQLINDALIKLITGQKVTSVYENLKLAQLKENISHTNYCSAIDYLGGEGPVVIELLA